MKTKNNKTSKTPAAPYRMMTNAEIMADMRYCGNTLANAMRENGQSLPLVCWKHTATKNN